MSEKFWDEKFETMSEGQMAAFQTEKLKETLRWVYEHVPYYQKAFDAEGIEIPWPHTKVFFGNTMPKSEKEEK